MKRLISVLVLSAVCVCAFTQSIGVTKEETFRFSLGKDFTNTNIQLKDGSIKEYSSDSTYASICGVYDKYLDSNIGYSEYMAIMFPLSNSYSFNGSNTKVSNYEFCLGYLLGTSFIFCVDVGGKPIELKPGLQWVVRSYGKDDYFEVIMGGGANFDICSCNRIGHFTYKYGVDTYISYCKVRVESKEMSQIDLFNGYNVNISPYISVGLNK